MNENKNSNISKYFQTSLQLHGANMMYPKGPFNPLENWPYITWDIKKF